MTCIINKCLHWDEVIERAMAMNPWFTEKNIRMALTSICEEMLDSQKLTQWSGQYPEIQDTKKVGLIMAGNLTIGRLCRLVGNIYFRSLCHRKM
jgi:hypothetical protein